MTARDISENVPGVPFETGPFEWWINDQGQLWMRHQCTTDAGLEHDVCRLPPPWRVVDDAVTPSLSCARCGAHVTVGPAEHVVPAWNWLIPVRDLCGSCDGRDAPDPTCEWCNGTGIDTGRAAPSSTSSPIPREDHPPCTS